MDISILPYGELSLDELYEILRIRNEVFIVEQQSIYQDLDGKDHDAVHLICRDGDRIVGILRILNPGVSFKEAAIGRIIALERGKGVGSLIVQGAIHYIRDVMKEPAIRIEAQVQAIPFYEKQGFVIDSDEFDDGGIMHREMVLRF